MTNEKHRRTIVDYTKKKKGKQASINFYKKKDYYEKCFDGQRKGKRLNAEEVADDGNITRGDLNDSRKPNDDNEDILAIE